MEVTATGRHCAHEFSKIKEASTFLHAQQKYPGLWRTAVLLDSILEVKSSPQGLACGKLTHTFLLTLPLLAWRAVSSSRMMEHCFPTWCLSQVYLHCSVAFPKNAVWIRQI